ncbi:hypothetical protein FQN54_008757 [Arachnomyces sp. PD_36]|nr:hypothetical protein FQN54_008757 [Arachnomyces sp. PD_36]
MTGHPRRESLALSEKPPGPEPNHRSSEKGEIDNGFHEKDEPRLSNTSPKEDRKGYHLSYRPDGPCPIDIGTTVNERYVVLYRLDEFEYPLHDSWLARDQKSSELVQLDIFTADSSEKAANGHHAVYFRNFLEELEPSKLEFIQNRLDEFWIDGADGRRICRVLEFAFLDPLEWQRNYVEEWYSTEDCRNLILALLQGLSEIHDQGLVHDDVAPENLVFTSRDANALSDQELRDLLGEPYIEPISNATKASKPGHILPETLTYPIDTDPLVKLKRQAKLRAFPPLLKCGEERPEPLFFRDPDDDDISDDDEIWVDYTAPELFNRSRNTVPEASQDVWAAACVIFEIVTGYQLFSGFGRPLISEMEETLGVIPNKLRREWGLGWRLIPWSPTNPLSRRIRHRFDVGKIGEKPQPIFNDEEHDLLVDLLEQMLEYDPSKRITSKEALKHPWFSLRS